MKKNIILICVFLVIFQNILFAQNKISNTSKRLTNQEIEDYFVEITMGSEFGKGKKVIRKWKKNIKYFVPNPQEVEPNLLSELKRVVNELNQIIGGKPQILEVKTRAESNFIVFFGKASQYISLYEPSAKDLVKGNWGLFWMDIDNTGFFSNGTMYVDTDRIKLAKEQRHILREEFTQAMGLMNDSHKYPESIFQQKWTDVNEYLPIDRQIIRLLYDPRIKIGMNERRARAVAKQILAIRD